MGPDQVEDERARFAAAYNANVRVVLGYAMRRVATPEDAADVVSETFLVAWRRWSEVPPGDPRPWLIGVARHVIANQRRSWRRRERLGSRLRDALSGAAFPDPAVEATERQRVADCLARLPEADRELLTLVAWEELTPSEAAEALGIAPGAARMRLSRARQRFGEFFGDTDGDEPRWSGQVSSVSNPREEER